MSKIVGLTYGVEDHPNPYVRTIHLRKQITPKCLSEATAVEGIEPVHSTQSSSGPRYQFNLSRGQRFSWDEVMPRVLDVLHRHGMIDDDDRAATS